LIGEPQAPVRVAEGADRAVVGYLLAHSHLAFFANGPVAWVEEAMVEEAMVDEAHRGAGGGRILMEHAEAWSTSIGAAYVAFATRRARPFHEALGYEDSAVFFRELLR
jgi:GNAT superfamily N-acetyltransferase